MKFPTLTLIAVALVVGCSKPAPTGTVASNTTAGTQGSTSTTASPTGTGSTTGDASISTPGTTAKPGTPTPTTPGKSPGTAPAMTPGKAPGPGAAPPNATATPGGQTAPQMTPEQKAEFEKRRAAAMKMMQDNAAKAEKATKSPIEGVSGTYVGFIDESTITPEMRKQPNFDANLAKAKEQLGKASVTVAANGDVVLKGMGPQPLQGFSTKIDGKPAFVFSLPKSQTGPPKQFAPVVIKNSGSVIVLGRFSFKKS